MPLIYNGTTIIGNYTVMYGSTSLTKIIYNGQTVWEKITSRTYRYKFAGALCGTSSGIDGSYPNGSGNFTIGTSRGAMWCVASTATDYTGFSTTFDTCMGKTITDMKLYIYRQNSQTFNTNADNSGWLYNPAPTSAGCKKLIQTTTTWHNNGESYVNTTTPVPTNTGLVQCSLNTSQLTTCFRMTANSISSAAGHSPDKLPAGSYHSLGLKGLYSNNPQFCCKSNDNTYGYIEITANS